MRAVHEPSVWALPDANVVPLEDRGPIWYVVMRSRREDGSAGTIGIVWVSERGTEGGFLAARSAGWLGAEMRRSYDGARDRGWDPNRIFCYWSDEDDEHLGLELDPAARAGGLEEIRRIVAGA